jgi:hypothetical protein
VKAISVIGVMAAFGFSVCQDEAVLFEKSLLKRERRGQRYIVPAHSFRNRQAQISDDQTHVMARSFRRSPCRAISTRFARLKIVRL